MEQPTIEFHSQIINRTLCHFMSLYHSTIQFCPAKVTGKYTGKGKGRYKYFYPLKPVFSASLVDLDQEKSDKESCKVVNF